MERGTFFKVNIHKSVATPYKAKENKKIGEKKKFNQLEIVESLGILSEESLNKI